jgi:hypothetical protein
LLVAAPIFAIGDAFRTFYSKHHIPAHEQRDYYHVYVRENTKELIVEPRIQVFPPETDSKKDAADDVCEYKILPLVKTGREDNATAADQDVTDGLTDGRDEKTTHIQDEYSEDDEEDNDSNDEGEELPFTIRPSKENKHEAVMEAIKKLNCEHKGRYEFDIVAVSCAGEVSKR